MNAVGTCRDRATAEVDVIMLAHCEHRPPSASREGHRGHAIVGTGREVDDHAIHSGQGGLQRGQRSDRNGHGTGTRYEVGQPGGPDQVVGEDGYPLAQDRISAR